LDTGGSPRKAGALEPLRQSLTAARSASSGSP
jgi:hypothetical protein